MKLFPARLSIRSALQSPTVTKYPKANDPDARRVSGKVPKQAKGKVSKALRAQTGVF